MDKLIPEDDGTEKIPQKPSSLATKQPYDGDVTEEDVLYRVTRRFESYEENTQESRALAEKCTDYYHGEQWDEETRATLEARRQPCVTLNRIASKIDFVLGMETRSRTDPKAYPREPGDDKSADIATAGLRYVCESQDFDSKWSDCNADVMIPGNAAMQIMVKFMPGQTASPEVVLEWIPWDRFFYDPHSRYHDFSDARFMGSVVWMDWDDAIERWPESAEMIENCNPEYASTGTGETTDDRPQWVMFSEDDRKRIKVIYMEYKVGEEVWVCTFIRGGFLEAPQVSPYLDQWGQPTWSIEAQSAKVDRKNNRYGAVKHLMGPQDEINQRRSRALHLSNNRQTIGEQGAVADVAAMKHELTKADGHVEINKGFRFELLETNDMAVAHMNLLAEAKSEIDNIGANAALTGKQEGGQSGRAIQARQQGGIVELEPIFMRMRQMKLRIYRAIWLRMKQFWKDEKWFRILGDDAKNTFVGVNIPVTAAEALIERGEVTPEEVQQMLQQGGPEAAMQLGAVVGYKNALGDMDVDIRLDEAADFITLAQEQFDAMVSLSSSGVQFPPEVLIMASSLKNKAQILEKMKGMGGTPEEQQAQAQQQQEVQNFQRQGVILDLQQKAATVDKTQAEAMRARADAEKSAADAAQIVMTPPEQTEADSFQNG